MEPFTQHHVIIPIDNFCEEDGPKVRKVFDRAVKKEVKGECRYKIKLPVQWLGLELCLRQQTSSVISYKECVEIGGKLNMTEEDVKHCLWFLHYKMGTIRHYSEIEELKDIVFTQPNVLFEAITDFIKSTFNLDEMDIDIQSKFAELGLFKTEDVESIYKKHSNKLPISFKQFIALFEHINVIGPAHDKEYDHFLGCALAHAPKPKNVDLKEHDPLIVCFGSGFLPNGIFSGTLARLCQCNWEIKCDTHGNPLLYRYQATFIAHDCPVTMKATPKHIEFTVDYKTNGSVCDIYLTIRQEVETAIREAVKRLGYSNEIHFGFYCSLSECKESEKHVAVALEENKFTKAKCLKTKATFNIEQKRRLWFTSNSSSNLDQVY